ncbi:RHS repeat domain-containing protein [Weeksella virosa]|uniref:RHS repeat domain-containing protein n=1 Tax=Weeksella virosa TaxID=1014 RepID=UPI0021AAEDBB|nr:RHS repeat-associated core domain-containing protein [Weeksella virosa]
MVTNKVSGGRTYNYVYNYTDHLGNVRLSYAWDDTENKLKILEENHYYPFGLKHKGYQPLQQIIVTPGEDIASNRTTIEAKFGDIGIGIDNSISTGSATYNYKFNGKELQNEFDINLYDYGARNYDPSIGRWMNVDPLAEEFPDWSPCSYGFNNPLRFTDPTGMAPEDIIIHGKNNSSVTIKTDLVDISVNAGSVVGDLGGNYTLQGDDVLIAALDIVGIVDPTGVADIAAASLEAKNGNWGSALLSGMGVIPYVGDIGKVGKVGKHLKTIEKAIENTASTSRAARREVMRKEGIPTSQQPKSQSKNSSGREYSYDVPKKGGGTQTKSVQQQTKDRSHQGQPHWEAGKVKTDNGRTRMNNYNRPKLDNNKSKVNY